MENKLEVGQTFEVYQVIKPIFMFSKDFIVGNQYISIPNYTKGDDVYLHNFKFVNPSMCWDYEVKPIGRLTVKKVKQSKNCGYCDCKIDDDLKCEHDEYGEICFECYDGLN